MLKNSNFVDFIRFWIQNVVTNNEETWNIKLGFLYIKYFFLINIKTLHKSPIKFNFSNSLNPCRAILISTLIQGYSNFYFASRLLN